MYSAIDGIRVTQSTDDRRHIASCHPEPNQYFCHWEYDPILGAWRAKYNNVIHFSSKDVHPLDRKEMSWALSKRDWIAICSSIQLLKYDKVFCETFSMDIVKLDFIMADICSTIPLKSCKCRRMDISHSIESVEHWGHVVWLYCKTMASQP
jgi:hypothetical protein